MPICTVCAYPADYLYTTYKTKSNIRLGVCQRCGNFLDPLIEHPPLLLLLDLILLKPRVYLHLLFNRGSRPFDTDHVIPMKQQELERSQRLRADFTTLALSTVLAETLARLQTVSVDDAFGWRYILGTLTTALAELLVQHIVTTVLALSALWWKGWYPTSSGSTGASRDGRQDYFSPIMIPLTLLYTTLLPLALQLVLSIWYTHQPTTSSQSTIVLPSLVADNIPPELLASIYDTWRDAKVMWDRTDRVWAGTKLLGGMSAGFGLRVILPTRPWETTAVVLTGWGAASMVARLF